MAAHDHSRNANKGGVDVALLEKPHPVDILSHALLCARCENRITDLSAATSIDGLHERVQANPAGVVFAFGCFCAADGCDIVGDPTTDHTWFPDHAWQLAMCDCCLDHMGWYFRSASGGFFGLILNRLKRA